MQLKMVPRMEGKEVIAVIGGTGDQGFGLALRWAKAGKHVIIGSRRKEKAQAAVARLKSILGEKVKVEGLENSEAAAKADIIVLTVPFFGMINIIKSIRDHLKRNCIFIDVTVPLASNIGGKPTRILGVWQGSAAELARELLPKHVKVAAAFKEVSAEALQDINSEVESDTIVCYDCKEAKEATFNLVKLIPGMNPIDGGKLENSRIVEYLTALLIGINIRYKSHRAGIRITGIKKE